MEKQIPITIDKVAHNEMNRAMRIKYPLSVAIIQIDNLLKIRQTYGETTCDQVMGDFQQECQKNIREIDSLFTFGDNSLILFLPGAGGEHAYVAAERIRSVASKGVVISPEVVIQINISIGISTFLQNQISIETLIDQARQAVDHAKTIGSNRVVGYEDL